MAANTGPMTTFRKGKPRMVSFDAGGSTYLSGDVIVKGAVPYVAHQDVPPFTGAKTLGEVSIGGGIYECVADGAAAVGADAFWDATNKKVTVTAVGNTHFGTFEAGPTFLLSGAGPAADGDLAWVSHDPRGGPTNCQDGNFSEATQSTTGTLTAAQILGGFVNSAPAGAITLTTDTAANLVAKAVGCQVGDRFRVLIENTSGGANAITLAAGAGVTLRGGTSVAQNKAAVLEGVFTNVTPAAEAVTIYSVVGA